MFAGEFAAGLAGVMLGEQLVCYRARLALRRLQLFADQRSRRCHGQSIGGWGWHAGSGQAELISDEMEDVFAHTTV